jgi:hypothetical protein
MKNLFRRATALFLLVTLVTPDFTYAFCGFYVAKADAALFNKSSQVILVRDGNETTLTMLNDYQGPTQDFAMVVPVPVVLKRDQIKTLSKEIFTAFDNYSGPRLVDYFDEDPCAPQYDYYGADEMSVAEDAPSAGIRSEKTTAQNYHVTVEAKYQVGEYDILILSAEESGGLERWLTDNGYKIPTGAKEVLEPYITQNLKFFVVKVNQDKLVASSNGEKNLSPLQIRFSSSKFMLPIRLGMANSTGDQDLIIYTLTRHGRVEPTNYRLAKLPTDKKIPEFIAKKFGPFYLDTYKKSWNREGKASLMLEYAWDISGTQSTKCDPCPAPVLSYAQLQAAGVSWITNDGWSAGGYLGDLFFTRIHARYNRSLYPQDFMFQETPNREMYQARYVITHPAASAYDCDASGPYLEGVIYRRREELNNLAFLTGWDIEKYDAYVKEYEYKYKNVTGEDFIPAPVNPFGGFNGPDSPQSSPWTLLFVLSLGIVAITLVSFRRKLIPHPPRRT